MNGEAEEMQVEQSEGAQEGVMDTTMDFAGMHDDGTGPGSADKMAKTLWVGSLEPWMDGLWMKQVFMQAGVTVVEAKVIRTGGVPSGYGFAEFGSVEDAAKVLEGYHGQPIPNHPSNKVFNLNWGARSEKRSGNDYSMFVGDLGPEVPETQTPTPKPCNPIPQPPTTQNP